MGGERLCVGVDKEAWLCPELQQVLALPCAAREHKVVGQEVSAAATVAASIDGSSEGNVLLIDDNMRIRNRVGRELFCGAEPEGGLVEAEALELLALQRR